MTPSSDLTAMYKSFPVYLWWMSCRRTITEIGDSILRDFMVHPRRADVTTQQQALDTIVNSAWWTTTLPSIASWAAPGAALGVLTRHHAACAAMLSSDEWALAFSGEEILRDLFTSVWTKRRPRDPEGRIEFVKAIGRAQRDWKRIPREIVDLRMALLARVGR